ncbi:hypothetical protein [Halarcobacter ebronensis]|uniref:Uncharacterized protein n=1 Tax=Halarcobacter ebronensis TaxID=1462615 RepID=A0A4Q1AW40_9BACT|nr:hypothetical protein [Halarcobacter ebronensis]QKF81707.1 hypothetical protein AEBR_1213 [Halarcobacter ebronensis]RXK04615.1 hypothetical protein CRV07_10695 [Halarcobacter ebronensis]
MDRNKLKIIYDEYGKIISVFISIVALYVSILSFNENKKANLINEEVIRPILTIENFDAQYSKNKIKFKFSLKNIGKSTAVIDNFQIATLKLGSDFVKKYDTLKNRIVQPNGITQEELVIDRFISSNNSNVEIDQTKINPKLISFIFKYKVRNKSFLYYEENTTGMSFNWNEVDKI